MFETRVVYRGTLQTAFLSFSLDVDWFELNIVKSTKKYLQSSSLCFLLCVNPILGELFGGAHACVFYAGDYFKSIVRISNNKPLNFTSTVIDSNAI